MGFVWATNDEHSHTPKESPLDCGTQTIQSIIDDIVSWQEEHTHCSNSDNKPFVTVTYAQSVDGKIALILPNRSMGSGSESGDVNKPPQKKAPSSSPLLSSNFALSDPESLAMTHALRSIHDAIIVGGNTLSVDNPRLNNRLWTDFATGITRQPRPIVLDTHLKYLKKLGNTCRASNVIACCSHQAAAIVDKRDLPESIELLACPLCPKTGRLDLAVLLQYLQRNYGIQSVMVEGGASVLTAFFAQRHLMNCLCVTLAPKFLLWRGLSSIRVDLGCNDDQIQNSILDEQYFASSKFLLLGKDSIFLARVKPFST